VRIFSAKLVHGVSAFYGSDEGFGHAIAAKDDRGVLLHIAALVQQQTTPLEGGLLLSAAIFGNTSYTLFVLIRSALRYISH